MASLRSHPNRRLQFVNPGKAICICINICKCICICIFMCICIFCIHDHWPTMVSSGPIPIEGITLSMPGRTGRILDWVEKSIKFHPSKADFLFYQLRISSLGSRVDFLFYQHRISSLESRALFLFHQLRISSGKNISIVHPDQTPLATPHSWERIANMPSFLILQSPLWPCDVSLKT